MWRVTSSIGKAARGVARADATAAVPTLAAMSGGRRSLHGGAFIGLVAISLLGGGPAGPQAATLDCADLATRAAQRLWPEHRHAGAEPPASVPAADRATVRAATSSTQVVLLGARTGHGSSMAGLEHVHIAWLPRSDPAHAPAGAPRCGLERAYLVVTAGPAGAVRHVVGPLSARHP